MFYRIILTSIAALLIILCFEISHIEHLMAQNEIHTLSLQRVAICDEDGSSCISPEPTKDFTNYTFPVTRRPRNE